MINKSTVKYIQSLSTKKFRDEEGAFVAEGPKLVKELITDNIFKCESVFCTQKGLVEIPKNLAERLGDKINMVEDFELDKISSLKTANNMLAVFKKKPAIDHPDFADKLTLVLDDIQDPGNLGTIIRIADWFGIENIFCSASTVDCYNTKVVQSTMASLGRVNTIYGSIKTLFSENERVKKYAAVLGGDDVKGFGKIKEGFIIIGNESRGISEEVIQFAAERISINKKGNAESLNAAVAAGIILFSVV